MPVPCLLQHLMACRCFQNSQGAGRCPPPEGTIHVSVCVLSTHAGIVQCMACEATCGNPAGKPRSCSQQQNHYIVQCGFISSAMTLHPEVRPSQPGNSRGVERGRVGKGKDRLAWPVWVLAGPGMQTPGRLVPTVCRVAQPTAHFCGCGAGGGELEGRSLSTYCEALSTYCEPGLCPNTPVTLSHLTLTEQVPYSHSQMREAMAPIRTGEKEVSSPSPSTAESVFLFFIYSSLLSLSSSQAEGRQGQGSLPPLV